MADAVKARDTRFIDGASRRAFPVKAGAEIVQGAMACLNAGVLAPGGAVAGLVCVGVAEQSVTGGAADGDERASTRRGVFHLANDDAAPLTLSDVGLPCYIVDNQTVSSSHNTNTRPVAGDVYDVDETGVWVEFKK